jgi:hypothetical protein
LQAGRDDDVVDDAHRAQHQRHGTVAVDVEQPGQDELLDEAEQDEGDLRHRDGDTAASGGPRAGLGGGVCGPRFRWLVRHAGRAIARLNHGRKMFELSDPRTAVARCRRPVVRDLATVVMFALGATLLALSIIDAVHYQSFLLSLFIRV